MLIGRAYYLNGWRMYDEAVDIAIQSIRLDRISCLVNITAFHPLSKVGRVEEAVSQLTKMREMYPVKLNETEMLYRISRVYKANGLYDEAVETHERIWSLQQEAERLWSEVLDPRYTDLVKRLGLYPSADQ